MRACDPVPWNLHLSTQSFDLFCEHSALAETVVSSDCVGVLICVDVIGSKVVSNRFCAASSVTVSSSWRSPPVSITLGRFAMSRSLIASDVFLFGQSALTVTRVELSTSRHTIGLPAMPQTLRVQEKCWPRIVDR